MSDARRIPVGDYRLNILSHGAGQRHFTCLHGLVDSLDIWKRLAPALESRGRVTRIDQRGHGASDSPVGPYSRSDLAGDVVGVLDAEGIDETILVGHSMGGIVAMATALEAPDRVGGLVLIGTTSECREKVADWYERIALAGEKDGNSGLGRAIYGEKSSKRIIGDARGIAHVTRMLKSLFTDPLTPRLGDIQCPALLAVGEKDPMGAKASEIVHDAMPPGRTELVRVPDKGHWLQIEAVDEIVAALDAWLAKFEL
ncbi:MAG: alpha/beta hydrolase [Deltaproteobacteria bacterium]|jgi:3-oxoadipate enol-lactonase|nr:alpha/beta hydrolase [Deltaproteobacteria bacterium]MBW2696168.1 alpha/beta hydrolase [Deltaproteobacteria bacterium]